MGNTPMHPSIKDSFGLMISGYDVHHYSPLVPNHFQNETSDIDEWVEKCGTDKLEECWWLKAQNMAMQNFRDETPGAGAYFNEADFFEPDFQETFWEEKITTGCIKSNKIGILMVFS